MLWIAFLTSYILCLASAQFGDGESSLPDEIPVQLQSKFNNTDVEKLTNKYIDYFKKKCEDSGHPEIYNDTQEAFVSFTTCLKSLVDVKVLEQEIEDAKPTGTVDEVFKKYCNRREEFKGCFRNLTDTVQPCFTAEEQKSFTILHNVTAQLAEFICFKDGERIALFIAEGGRECFQQQQESLQTCFNTTVDPETQHQLKNLTSEIITSPFELEFKEKQCNQMSVLQGCVVSTLEQCEAPTTSNIVESLFKYIRKGTPCSKFKVVAEKSKSGNASSGKILSMNMAMAIVAIVALVLV